MNAVEWLEQEYRDSNGELWPQDFDKAKKMEYRRLVQAQINILSYYKSFGSIVTEEIENLQQHLKQLES
jgi:hypothetical protein